MWRTLTLPFLLSFFCCQGFINDCTRSTEDTAPQCTGFEVFHQPHSNCDKHLVYITAALLSDICSPNHVDIWKQIKNALADENNVEIILRSCQHEACNFSVTHYEPVPNDRVCLIKSPYPLSRVRSVLEGDDTDVSAVLDFINTHTKSNRHLNGTNTRYGTFLNNIKNDLYKVPSSSKSPSCDRISFQSLQLDPQEFILKYWLRQQPVIIENFPSIHNNDDTDSIEKNPNGKPSESSTSTVSSILDVSYVDSKYMSM
jgi:hypothetical protein